MPVNQLPDILPPDPLPIFNHWFETACAEENAINPNAMTLATIIENNQVAARVVLCKQIVSDPGYLLFYTNYDSAKAKQLAANANIAAVFYWNTLGRQVRIEGVAQKSPEEESDRYFMSRDIESQIGAWTSDQSSPIRKLPSVTKKTRRNTAAFRQRLGQLRKSKLDPASAKLGRL